MNRASALSVATAVIALAIANGAHADNGQLPDAVIGGFLGVGNTAVTNYGDHWAGLGGDNFPVTSSYAPGSMSFGAAHFTTAFGPNPEISIGIDDNPLGAPTGVQASITYFVEIVGPASSGLAPVTMTYSGTATNLGDAAENSQQYGLFQAFFGGIDGGIYTDAHEAGSFSYSGTLTQQFAVNTPFAITLSLDAIGGGEGDSTSLFLDPILSLGADSLALGYSLEFSPGIGNDAAGGVPEPGAWTLMLVGFGALGASLRRRRLPTAA